MCQVQVPWSERAVKGYGGKKRRKGMSTMATQVPTLKAYRFDGYQGDNRITCWMNGTGIRSLVREIRKQGFTGTLSLDTDNGTIKRNV